MSHNECLRYYSDNIENFKKVGGNKYMGLCPFHNDTNPSISVDGKDLVFKCHSTACGKGGDTYQFALLQGHPNPHQFSKKTMVDAPTWVSTPKVKPPKVIDYVYLSNKMEGYKNRLKKNMSLFPKYEWNEKLIDELGIGLDENNKFMFAYLDDQNRVKRIQQHHGYSDPKGFTTTEWYLGHKIASYSEDKWTYLLEGGKDALCTYSEGLQSLSTSNGCGSIPDVNLIKHLNKFRIPYDNDKDGEKGAIKLAKEILSVNPDAIIQIYKWIDKSAKWDVFDEFELDRREFLVGDNWEDIIIEDDDSDEPLNVEYYEIRGEKVKPIKFLSAKEFKLQEYLKTEPIIKDMFYKGQTAIIGGDDGTRKSWASMQCACAIASGQKVFEAFETKQQNVLYCQFENENFDVQERYAVMSKYFTELVGNDSWESNIRFSEIEPDTEDFIDNWKRIEAAIIQRGFKDGVLIVDNMYTSTDLTIEENKELKKLMRIINTIRRRYNLSILLIAHTVKESAQHDKQLLSKQIQGGAVLKANVANINMIGNSSASNELHIFKITKAGRSSKNNLKDVPFKLYWDDDKAILVKGAIVPSEALHFQPMKEGIDIKILKAIAYAPEVRESRYMTRTLMRKYAPENADCRLGSPTAEGRWLEKISEWGWIDDCGRDKWRINYDALKDWVTK